MPIPIAVKIIPNIYIGNIQASQNKQFFDSENIKAVLNCTFSLPNFYCHNPDIEYLRIPVHDNDAQRDWYYFYTFFPVATEFIYKNAVIENKNILIHCNQGKQRSATVLAAYLIKFYEIDIPSACNQILKYFPGAFNDGQHLNFNSSLQKWRSKYID